MATIENTRRAYKLLQVASGLTPSKFNWECRGVIAENRDGEGEGDPSPEEWLMAAREVTTLALMNKAQRSSSRVAAELRALCDNVSTQVNRPTA